MLREILEAIFEGKAREISKQMHGGEEQLKFRMQEPLDDFPNDFMNEFLKNILDRFKRKFSMVYLDKFLKKF